MDEVLDSGLLGTIASMPIPADLLKKLQMRLRFLLPQTSGAEAVVSRLQRFIAATRSPTSLLAFFDRDESALETLLRLLGAGQRLADQLVADPEAFDLVRASGGGDVHRDILIDEIVSELDALIACGGSDQSAVMLLRSVAGRERLRIAYAEFVAGAPPERVSRQLTILAEAIIESALHFASTMMARQYGWPRTPAGDPGRLSVIGLGTLASGELSYFSPLQAMFLCDLCGPTDGSENLAGDEFFRRLCQRVMTLVRGQASGWDVCIPDTVRPDDGDDRSVEDLFTISLDKRPLGADGPIVTTVTEAHRHYQLTGRTWERLALVKSRVVAGDVSLGGRFLELIEPWVYRRYLQPADLEGLQTLMRKFVRRLGDARPSGIESVDQSQPIDWITATAIRSRDGGLDDIEAVIGMLQLINGTDLPELRGTDTVKAIEQLLLANCLTVQEAALLSDHYRLLRRCEDCFQVDRPFGKDAATPSVPTKAASVPSQASDLTAAAWNLGYRL